MTFDTVCGDLSGIVNPIIIAAPGVSEDASEASGGSVARAVPELQLAETDDPLHERLANALAALIADGRLAPGERLPSHRVLAQGAGVAIGTVTRAVDMLTRRGLVRGEVGRGTFVSELERKSWGVPVDLTLNVPPLMIEEALFLQASERAARRVLTLPAGGLHDLRGTEGQRAIVARWLSRTRLEAEADGLLLCVGAQQAIHLAFADLAGLSPSIACEAATFSGAIAAAVHLGLGWEVVDHDAEGMMPDDLDRAFKETGCRMVYTTPVCQNPLGFEVSEARRLALIKVCEAHNAFIVEDDVYGLYATAGPVTYKALAPDRTYYLTSLSKCLTPLVRLGVLVPPEDRLPPLLRALRADVFGAPPSAVELGCALIELGADAIAAEALRREAKARIDLARKVLRLADVPMPEGSPHLWLPMPAVAAEKLARRCSEHRVRLTPPDATSLGGDKAGGVRLCTLAPDHRDDLERALHIIARLMRDPEETVI